MDLRADLQTALGAAYTVERELGGGGMSHLYVARDEQLGRQVVVKVVAAVPGAKLSIERFRREVALAASLQHPHIVSVLSAGEVDGLPYFIMPYVEGQSLRQRLEQGGALRVADAVSILRDVARALAYAHERGVVHRDIKPDNVLLAGTSATLNDFGIAKALDSARERTGGGTLTQEGYALGTPGYMAPEQVAGDPKVDHRADIYAFGVLAYEMLTGKTPFHGLTPHQLLTAQLTAPPPAITSVRTELPSRLAELVMRCLATRPEDRPQAAADLVAWIDDPAVVSGPLAVTTILMPAATRTRRIAAGLALLGAVALGVAGTWLFRPPAAPAAPERSVAVLPLANVGADSATAYLADGLTDEITLALSRLPSVRVASPSAAAAFRGRQAAPADIGRELGVATLLEGSVQVSGGRLRLVARLTDAHDGSTLWSQRFEGDVANIFDVQDSIAAAIAEAMRQRFGGGAPVVAAARGAQGTSDVEAYDAFLRGRFLFQRRSPDALRGAIEAFEEAIERDPGFARAWAGLADAYAVLPLYLEVPPDSLHGLALDAVERALALDSTLADALASRGYLQLLLWRWAEAGDDLERAARADSSAVNAWQWWGEWLLYNGRTAEAVEALAHALRQAPTSPVNVALHALALAAARRPAEAIPAAQRAVAMDSAAAAPRFMLGATLLYAGRASEAIAPLERARTLGADGPVVMGLLGAALGRAGRTDRAAALRDTLLTRAGTPGATAALVHVSLGLGDTAQALTWLEWSAGAKDAIFASQPLVAPLYDPIRQTDRFRAVLARVGLDARVAAAR